MEHPVRMLEPYASEFEIAMKLGSPMFEAYNRTLRRIMWADFVDEHLRVAREQQYKASIVDEAYLDRPSIASAMALLRKTNK